MAYDENARVDSQQLEWYRWALSKAQRDMDSEIEQLKNAYVNADWNDMVSAKAGLQLNDYIDSYNRAMEKLEVVISAVTEMCEHLEEYKSVVD